MKHTIRDVGIVAIIGTVALAATAIAGQRATEQYIPIGASPGVSGEAARMGTIASFDADARTLTVTTDNGPVVAEITDETRIWLDRSELGETNIAGSVDDLAAGREVEILSEEAERRGEGPARWIKVRPTS